MITTTPSTAALTTLAIREVGALFEMSPTPIRKALQAGVLPDLTLRTVAALAERDVITSAIADNGEPVPVLRLGPAQSDTSLADPRRQYGYSATMAPSAVADSIARWWEPSGSHLVLAAGCMLVATGGWLHTFVDVHGILAKDQDGKLHYDITVVARCTDLVARNIHVITPSSPNVTTAAAALGLRVLGGRGGSITSM